MNHNNYYQIDIGKLEELYANESDTTLKDQILSIIYERKKLFEEGFSG